MTFAIVLVAGLAYWDEQRESTAALEDLAAEQTVAASSLAAGLSAHVEREPDPTPSGPRPRAASEDELRRALENVALAVAGVESPRGRLVLLQPPRSTDFLTTDGRHLTVDALRAAPRGRAAWVRLVRADAASLGLPARTAFAGVAEVGAGALAGWRVVAVATAMRERDREIRASWRLVLGVGVASALVILFGGIALRIQRKELELEREIAVMEAHAERDDRLARATRAAVMGTFAMGIAHEVSTPLGVILGRAEQIMSRVSDDERASHAARVIIEQADRLKLLVRSFLDLARGGSPTFVRVDASTFVRSAVALVDHRFRKSGVTLALDIPDELPTVQCDPALLEHALINLLLNACEACESGNAVRLSACADGRRVAFVVTDDGVGIDPADAARATEAFFTTKPEGQGTGLGLAIASEIVKSHRGVLTIEPWSPRGTVARIEIPSSPDEGRHEA